MTYFDDEANFLETQTLTLKAELDNKRLAQAVKAAERKAVSKLIKADQAKFFDGGSYNALNSDWIGSVLSPNQDVKASLKVTKSRARDLFNNSPVIKSFVSITQQSVKPFKFSSRVCNSRKGLNTKVTTKIEDAWADFTKAGNFEVTGQFSLNECLDQMIIQLLVDGEILLRKVHGRGKYGFQIQLIHTDRLMIESHNSVAGPYAMGIERDEWGTPIAYYINAKMPTEGGGTGATQLRLPASEIIHAFLPHAVGAVRGMPVIHASMATIQALDAYRNAVVVAARMAACSSVVYEQNGVSAEPYDGAEDEAGLAMTPGLQANSLSPGQAEALPPGIKKVLLTPNQPTQSFGEFNKNLKKEIAAGLNLSYNILYSDFESTSFSSMKAAFIQDKAYVSNLQEFFITKVLSPLFEEFLDTACSLGKIQLPPVGQSYEIYKDHRFIGKGFAYLDPLKDVQAQVAALSAGLVTRTDLLAEQGKDLEETLATLQAEKALMAEYGIEIIDPNPKANPALGTPGSAPNTPEIETEDTPQPNEPDGDEAKPTK